MQEISVGGQQICEDQYGYRMRRALDFAQRRVMERLRGAPNDEAAELAQLVSAIAIVKADVETIVETEMFVVDGE